jgi:rubrerythrin
MVALTAVQAVQVAIESQAAAAAYFEFLADRAGDSRTREFLRGLAEIESHHGQDLRAMIRILAGPDASPSAHHRVRIDEAAPGWVCAEGESLQQGLQTSVRYERQSASFFEHLADQFAPPGSAYLRLLARSKECYVGMVRHAASELEVREQGGFSLQEAVRNAIQAEHACCWVYRGLSARTRDPRARAFLEDMVRVQQVHVAELERLAAGMADERPVRRMERISIAKTAPLFRYPDIIELGDALQIAFEAETRASRYFAALSRQFGGKAAAFFLQLSKAEEEHGLTIRQAMSKAA